jgi:ATP-dependent DNA helicase RecG
MELAALLRRPEGKTLEYKRDLSSPEGVLKTVVAFSNTAGGTIVLGVEDASRRVLGIRDVLATEERIANIISDGIRPRVVPDIDVIPWRKLQIIAIEIYPSNTRPHYLARLGPEEGVFIRVGSTNRRADSTHIEELRRFSRMDSFDEQPIPDLKMNALDFPAISASFATIRKLSPAALRTLRMAAEYQGRLVPTIGGLLLFGAQRLERFPDAWLQAGRFRGTDRSHIADSTEIRSYLPNAAEQAIEFVHKHSRRETIIDRVRRREQWAVPPVVIREAIMNAVVHADYAQQGSPIRLAIFDDRMEVDNPGLLPFGLTVEDIQMGVSKLRNRVIGRVFHELRLIEQWGSGIQRMIAACAEAGIAKPVFAEVGTHFRVIISTVRIQKPNADDKVQLIMQALDAAEALSTADVARIIRLSPRAARTRLKRLVERGTLVEIGSGPHDPQRRYARLGSMVGSTRQPSTSE